MTSSFLAAGGEPRASEYIAQKAAEVFVVNAQGQLTATSVAPDGSPWTVESWLAAAQQSAMSFAFKPSRGGGASTSAGGGGSKPTVSRHDVVSFGQNLEGIARGRVTLVD